jgi:hypothetical protein
MRLDGKVVRGRGKGAGRIGAIADGLALELGSRPVAGTLNVILSIPIEFDPRKAIFRVDNKRLFWPVELNGVSCLAYRWKGCPLHIVEVVSVSHLRDELNLVDGSSVVIQAPHARHPSLKSLLAWTLLWALRQRYYYASDPYILWTKGYPKIRKWAGQRYEID